MPSIVGTLIDKRGNVQPNAVLIARIANDPAGDSGSYITDINGNYDISISESGTKYYLYITSEEGGVNGPNFSGYALSSGDVLSGFVLAADSTWKTEHYGDDDLAKLGEHKDIIVDSVYFRSGGTINGDGVITVQKPFVHDEVNGYPSIDSYVAPPGDLYFATKQYVDAQVVAGILAGDFLDLDGATMNFGIEHADNEASDAQACDSIAMYDESEGITVSISREDFLSGFLDTTGVLNGEIPIGRTGDTVVWNTITGTANQINVVNTPGVITISTPQDIHTGATPTFASMTLSGLTANTGLYADAAKVITSYAAATNGQIPIGSTGTAPVIAGITETANQVLVANAAGTITLSTPQDIHTGATPQFAQLGLGIAAGAYMLYVYKDVATTAGIRIENPNAGVNAKPTVDYINDLGGTGFQTGLRSSNAGGTIANEAFFYNGVAGGTIGFTTGGSAALNILNNQNIYVPNGFLGVGILPVSPLQSYVDVDSGSNTGVKIQNASAGNAAYVAVDYINNAGTFQTGYRSSGYSGGVLANQAFFYNPNGAIAFYTGASLSLEILASKDVKIDFGSLLITSDAEYVIWGATQDASIGYEDAVGMVTDYDLTAHGGGWYVKQNTTDRLAVLANGALQSFAGRRKNTTRITSADSPYTMLVTDDELFCDSDGGAITVNLLAGVVGTRHRIINCGSSGNDVTVSPNGAELLFGVNSDAAVTDGDAEILVFESTENWW